MFFQLTYKCSISVFFSHKILSACLCNTETKISAYLSNNNFTTEQLNDSQRSTKKDIHIYMLYRHIDASTHPRMGAFTIYTHTHPAHMLIPSTYTCTPFIQSPAHTHEHTQKRKINQHVSRATEIHIMWLLSYSTLIKLVPVTSQERRNSCVCRRSGGGGDLLPNVLPLCVSVWGMNVFVCTLYHHRVFTWFPIWIMTTNGHK